MRTRAMGGLIVRRVAMASVLAAACGTTLGADGVPVTDITLYRSGMGYFERTGTVTDDSTLSLRVGKEQVNDILKSLVLLDLDGGRIDGVTYGSRDPLARRLAGFMVDISDNPDMATLLDRLRGARVRVSAGGRDVEGTVLGVERRRHRGDDGEVRETAHVNVLTARGLRSIDLASAMEIDILDEALARELERALAVLAEHRSEQSRTLELAFRGSGERRVHVSYVLESPVWKTSYRLVLPDDAPSTPGAEETLTLQGWAIVENTTDEDWEDVRLSLVSGRPFAFRMDLYEPLFLERPELPVPVIAQVGPAMRPGGMFQYMRTDEQRFGDVAAAPARAVQERARLTADEMVRYAAGARAEGVDVGEMFQYRIDAPVSIGRQQSAMLPILTGAVEGRRVSVFNAGDGQARPWRAVELKNTADVPLVAGPVSVFDAGAYGGDAQLDQVGPGGTELLRYALDLDLDVAHEGARTTYRMQRMRIVGGMMERTRMYVRTTAYSVHNRDERRGRAVVIEHQRPEGWELRGPEPDEETAGRLARFSVRVGPGERETLTVNEERVDRQEVGLMDVDMPTLVRFASEGRVSDRVLEAVREAVRLHERVREAERAVQALETERREIGTQQQRIRENMRELDRGSDLYARYIRTMDEQEDRLEALEGELRGARETVEARRGELEAYLRDLNVE